MALPCFFSVALVLLSCHSLCCLACHLPDTHGLRNWRVLTLLGQMRRLSAGSCDHYTNDFAFPKELFDGQRLQEAQALSVVHVMTQKVFHLFCPDTRLSAGSCDHYTNDFAFPKELFDGQRLQEAQALSVVHVMTQKVFHLFCPDTSSAPWNMTLLEELCSGLSEQLDDLEACPLQEAGLAETPLMHEDSTLRTYFQRISLYLQDRNHSPCAWEMVRAEIGRSFFSSTILQERIRRRK
uniref:Uncharacterized protein n=1 Tax=Canis lupus familiaris TaxID=9615 RepID=A0A8C0M9Q0_CANLF